MYGLFKKRIYALGRWYSRVENHGQYWQVIQGYLLLGLTLAYSRFLVLPDRLFHSF